MKKCSKCGKVYPDDLMFCVKCGSQLVVEQKDVRTDIDQRYQQNDVKTSTPVKKKSNGPLVVIIVFLIVAIIASGIVIFVFLMTGDSKGADTPIGQIEELEKQQTSGTEQSSDVDLENDSGVDSDVSELDSDGSVEQSENNEPSSDKQSEVSLDNYQEYYDGVDKTFDRLIISSTDMGKYSVYIDEFGKALIEKNPEECEKYYNELKTLEDSLKKSSERVVKKLQKELKKLNKKKGASDAKKNTEYVKAEAEAKTSAELGDYKNAKKKYDICIKKMKEAIKKAKKKKKTSTNDDWYRRVGTDDSTWQSVYYYQLDSGSVRRMGTEEKRYYMNTLFACYGYRFNNSTIQSFFDRQSWYTPNYSISVGNQEAIKRMFDSVAEYNYQLLGGS